MNNDGGFLKKQLFVPSSIWVQKKFYVEDADKKCAVFELLQKQFRPLGIKYHQKVEKIHFELDHLIDNLEEIKIQIFKEFPLISEINDFEEE